MRMPAAGHQMHVDAALRSCGCSRSFASQALPRACVVVARWVHTHSPMPAGGSCVHTRIARARGTLEGNLRRFAFQAHSLISTRGGSEGSGRAHVLSCACDNRVCVRVCVRVCASCRVGGGQDECSPWVDPPKGYSTHGAVIPAGNESTSIASGCIGGWDGGGRMSGIGVDVGSGLGLGWVLD